jgi:hypothetical protein
MPLTPHGRREAEVDLAIYEASLRRIMKIAGSYGLSPTERSDREGELRRQAVARRGEYREIADIWREGSLRRGR